MSNDLTIAYMAGFRDGKRSVKLEDIEQYRMQMAGISSAAIGYWKEGDSIHPDYDTPALHDVALLYSNFDELYKKNCERGAYLSTVTTFTVKTQDASPVYL